jgi:hypothetical protein
LHNRLQAILLIFGLIFLGALPNAYSNVEIQQSNTKYQLGNYLIDGTEVSGDITGTFNYTSIQHMTFYFFNNQSFLRMKDLNYSFTVNLDSLLQVGSNTQFLIEISYSLNRSLQRPLVIQLNFTSKVDLGATFFRFYIANASTEFTYPTSVSRSIRSNESGTWENGFVCKLDTSKGKCQSFLWHNDGLYDILELESFGFRALDWSISTSEDKQVLLSGDDPVETRYFRGDSAIVNGLLAKKLLTTQSGTGYTVSGKQYYGVRVWKRMSNGTETEITSGSAVAVIDSDSVSGVYSNTWNCSETALVSTDTIKVIVYYGTTSSPATALGTWSTEQLGASYLNASTWTVYYDIYYELVYAPTYRHLVTCEYAEVPRWVDTWTYRYDTGYYSRIENFVWTQAVTKSWHDVIWSFNLTSRQVNHVYWIQNLTAMQWNSVTWLFNVTGKEWHQTVWAITLDAMGWHHLYWVFTLEPETNMPVLFVGLAFFGFLALAIIGWRLKKRRL